MLVSTKCTTRTSEATLAVPVSPSSALAGTGATCRGERRHEGLVRTEEKDSKAQPTMESCGLRFAVSACGLVTTCPDYLLFSRSRRAAKGLLLKPFPPFELSRRFERLFFPRDFSLLGFPPPSLRAVSAMRRRAGSMSSTRTLSLSPTLTTSFGSLTKRSAELGHMDQTILVHTHVNECAEGRDVGDHAFELHPFW